MSNDFHKQYVKFKDVKNNNDTLIEVELPNKCPICYNSILPVTIDAHQLNDIKKNTGVAILKCPACFEIFAVKYSNYVNNHNIAIEISPTGHINAENHPMESKLLSITPYMPEPYFISNRIEKLSPPFKTIYQEAKWAKDFGLINICGIAFRKALEFLVKDYCIHLYPEKSADIKKMPLMQCIEQFIENTKIKTLSSRSTWLGNDEAHYERLHEERDFEDLEVFIDTLIKYIDMDLTVEEAQRIEYKK